MAQEHIWKDDAAQLKADLDSREREVQLNEVPITVGRPGQASVAHKAMAAGSSQDDQLLKKLLGL